jgi:nicotinamidase-related amidase
MKKLLIVIDMQNDFIDGSLGSEMARAIVPRVREKIEAYGTRGDYIIFTRDTHGPDYLQTQEGRNLPVKHCVEGTDGWEIYGGLDGGVNIHAYVNKPSFGYAGWEGLLKDVINEISGIELCGLCTDICVVSNAMLLKAFFPETPLAADARCMAGVTEESHRAAITAMRMCQVNVINT